MNEEQKADFRTQVAKLRQRGITEAQGAHLLVALTAAILNGNCISYRHYLKVLSDSNFQTRIHGTVRRQSSSKFHDYEDILFSSVHNV